MRRLAFVAIAAGCGAAGGGALAQGMAPQIGGAETPAAALADAAFASGAGLHGAAQMLNQQSLDRWQGPSSLRIGEVRVSPPDRHSVDIVHFSAVQPLISPSGLPFAPGQSGQTQAYAVTLERAWPSAFAFETGGFGVDFSPHAGVGMTSYGGVAEAGGRIELSQKRDEMAKERLKALGVRDGADFGDQGRWYLFAAASGRAVGLNMLRGDAGWTRAGVTTDATSTLVGDAQVGVGWRKGAIQTSLGYVHQQLKNDHLLYGQDNYHGDSMVAFTFSVRPSAR